MGASDVYYFVLGAKDSTTPLDEVFAGGKVSTKRPSDKVFTRLVCRLCHPCVYDCFLLYAG